jgi:methyl-accepting chemotaxis protein
VVADEVRNLALRAAEAAKDTDELIAGTIERIDQGAGLVKEVDHAFGELATSSAKVADLVNEIAAASREQADGITQVNQAVGQMDQVVQRNAANAEESAAASEELNGQAETLHGVVAELVTLVEGGNGEIAAMRRTPGRLAAPSSSVDRGRRIERRVQAQPPQLASDFEEF